MITVQIGNTDDRLTQADWSDFYLDVDGLIQREADSVYFSGCSMPAAPWQNACWCFDVPGDVTKSYVKRQLAKIAKEYRQDSIAWTEGETEFLSTKESGL